MAAVLARLHVSAIARKQQQQRLLQYALRRPPTRLLPLLSAPFLGRCSRRLKYNAAAGVSLGDKAGADHHHAIGDLDDELLPEEHSGAGSSPPLSSREYHSFAQTEAAADGDGAGEKMVRPPRRGSKAGLLGWGEPVPGGGPHTY